MLHFLAPKPPSFILTRALTPLAYLYCRGKLGADGAMGVLRHRDVTQPVRGVGFIASTATEN